MTQQLTRWCLLGLVMSAGASLASAQTLALRPDLRPISDIGGVVMPGELYGVVQDQRGEPLTGVVVSALGSTTAFAVSDRDGRFFFRSLPPGPYLVRAHLQGYHPARGRVVQVSPEARSLWMVALNRRSDDQPAATAGIAMDEARTPEVLEEPADAHDHNEVAWRLRHVRRSVLRNTQFGAPGAGGGFDSFIDDSLDGLGRAFGTSARMASALFTDVGFTGQVNLLTTTSFDRPQDLFSLNAGMPQPVAYVSLAAPGASGDWTMRGAVTQGDLASWIVAGEYVRHANAVHAYEVGLSYSTQRYLGGNAEALAAMRDGSRNVGSIHAYDHWALNPRLTVSYGAKVANYDYLPDRGLVSPQASLTVKPIADDTFRVRASVSHRETAPGAEEFTAPAIGVWLPPERTFSPVSHAGFRPQRLDHVELAAERQWGSDFAVGIRAFRQQVADQVVTLFDVAVAESPTSLGHYRVGSAGDFDATGWGVSVDHALTEGLRASLNYTVVDVEWLGTGDRDALARIAGSLVRDAERIHDVTASVQTVVAPTATRIYLIYKLNNAFTSRRTDAVVPGLGTRFDVQVNQSLPFFSSKVVQLEMLLAVSNLFYEELTNVSVYDELLVLRTPKRVLGGVTVRF